jgi:hypothetical protein
MPSHCGGDCACACNQTRYVNRDIELTEEEYKKIKTILGGIKSEKLNERKKNQHNQKIQKEIEELNKKIKELEKNKL